MEEKIINIQEGIRAHVINNNVFKTDLISVFFTIPLKRETVTLNSMIPFILKDGNSIYKSQIDINKKFEELYGAEFDYGVDKIGDNQIVKFFVETIDQNYVLKNENILKLTFELLFNIIFDNYFSNECFKKEYFDIEKDNMRKIINSKIDNKDFYAFNRCIEEMYGKKGFGLFKYGYVEDLNNITVEDLYKAYLDLINFSKIDVYISGNVNLDIKNYLLNESVLNKLPKRKINKIYINSSIENVKIVEKIIEKQEEMNITQGKLIIGLDSNYRSNNQNYIGIIYNSILGDGVNSFLFQNVREKAGLAYTTKSNFNKFKNSIFIRCGIEIKNYKKALELIKKQISNISENKFTDEDLLNAKNYIVSEIKFIETEQDSQIVFCLGQEIANNRYSIEDYIKNIEAVTRENVLDFAKQIQIDTVYFLKGIE